MATSDQLQVVVAADVLDALSHEKSGDATSSPTATST
jgi:hypothetical protein